MEKISINDIEIIRNIGKGSYSEIHKVIFDNKKYAFKQYKNDNVNAKELIDKYDELNSLKLTNALIPNIFVEDENLNGFLMRLSNHKCYSYIIDCPLSLKIQKLKEAKQSLLEVHSKNIIHGDIHINNFLLDEVFLIDFDNSQFGKFKLNHKFCSEEALEFLKKYKLSKDLDIYLFNIMTFYILNGCDYYEIETDIFAENYGVFTSKDSKKICKSLLLQDKIFNNDFLIDTLNYNGEAKKIKKIGRG